MMEAVRVGVVGAGLISQGAHLPMLSFLHDHFAIVALAEPSERVRVEVGRRYNIPGVYADYRQILEAGGVDALVVCSPNATHAPVIMDALQAGLHVFVEKPLCISLADVDRIIALRDAADKVVQVGYTKSFDLAYEAMCADLPDTIDGLRYINVLTYESAMQPYFSPIDMVLGNDLSDAFKESSRREEEAQVAAAVGTHDPREIFMFSEIYLGTLIHDVNLVHGLLKQMNSPLPCRVNHSTWWDGPAATVSFTVPNGAQWGLTWVETTKWHDFRQQLSLFFEDSVHTISYPPPYLFHSPAVYERNAGTPSRRESRVVSSYHERFTNELVHFHDCITQGVTCRTPPEQSRLDIQVLTDAFLASHEAQTAASLADDQRA